MLFSGLPRTTSASGQNGIWTRDLRIRHSNHLATLPEYCKPTPMPHFFHTSIFLHSKFAKILNMKTICPWKSVSTRPPESGPVELRDRKIFVVLFLEQWVYNKSGLFKLLAFHFCYMPKWLQPSERSFNANWGLEICECFGSPRFHSSTYCSILMIPQN